jgi:twitching motility protein PilT
MSQLIQILQHAIKLRASDVHINVGQPPLMRIDLGVSPAKELPIVTATMAQEFASQLMPPERFAEFEKRRDADFSCNLPGIGRARVNAHYQRGTIALAIRLIDSHIRPLEQLFLPDVVAGLTYEPHGLILVTGPTGSGKSTTLAAMIEAINHRESSHIITLEDPIEYTFSNALSCIEQREVGSDVPDFASGLRHALRQDPDVILVGEMRDLETTRAAVTAAETGHLVMSTLHTSSAMQTVERIVDQYPSEQQNAIRSMLANTLCGVVSQTLIPRIDRAGVIAAVEVLVATPAVRSCIRENRMIEIVNVIATGRSLGMQSLDDSIRDLFQNGYISRESALAHASNPERLNRSLAA